MLGTVAGTARGHVSVDSISILIPPRNPTVLSVADFAMEPTSVGSGA